MNKNQISNELLKQAQLIDNADQFDDKYYALQQKLQDKQSNKSDRKFGLIMGIGAIVVLFADMCDQTITSYIFFSVCGVIAYYFLFDLRNERIDRRIKNEKKQRQVEKQKFLQEAGERVNFAIPRSLYNVADLQKMADLLLHDNKITDEEAGKGLGKIIIGMPEGIIKKSKTPRLSDDIFCAISRKEIYVDPIILKKRKEKQRILAIKEHYFNASDLVKMKDIYYGRAY